jgi:fructoselysine 6-kinase
VRLLGIGDNVVDRYLEMGTMFPGGNALNVAVAARRAGAVAAYLGALGDDAAGRVILDALRAEAVETNRVRIRHGPNAYALVHLVEGDRAFVGGDHGVSRFVLSLEDVAYAATFDLIHTGDCSFFEGQVADLAATGPPVSFDFSVHREAAYVEPLLPHIQIAFFSASDLDDNAAEQLLHTTTARGPRLALATRGSADVVLHDGRRTWRQPVVVKGPIVDTLGAGDSFIGRFLVGVMSGEDPKLSLQAAAEAASVTCGRLGAFGYGCPVRARFP